MSKPVGKDSTGWEYFRDKILPGLFLILTSLVISGAWKTYRDIQAALMATESYARQLVEIRAEMRAESQRTIEQARQQIEIAILRAAEKSAAVNQRGKR